MTKVLAAWRALGALAILIALVATTYAAVRDGVFFFWNFFGYFTIQSNVIGMIVLAIALPFTGKARPALLEYARASATVYLMIVGIVYWTLLTGYDVQIAYPWANVILHGISSVIILVDWLFEGPRLSLPVKHVWTVLIYPAVWLAVVLTRGATDGWVPYPFLNPDRGYGAVAIVCAGIVVVGVVFGVIFFKLTRWRTGIAKGPARVAA